MNMMLYITTPICVLMFLISSTNGVPRQRLTQAGPCIGMDCLHGVLMHGDSEVGDSHQDEDTYNKLQEMDKDNLVKKDKPGPCQGEDCLHDLMHNVDEEHKDQGSIGPELKAEDGPCEGMDCLHGVLMHADEKTGKQHELEDEALRKVEENKELDGPCVDCVEGKPHKHLPLDTQDASVSNDETEHRDRPVATDPDQLLHASGGDAHVVKELMDEEQDTVLKFKGAGVESADKFLHVEGFDHDAPKEEELDQPRPRPGTTDPERLLHDDEDIHSKHPKNVLKKITPGTFDPHAMLHGGDSHAHDDNKDDERKLKEKIKRHENRDIEKIRDKLSDKSSEDDATLSGYSMPYISDTLEDDIEQMKAKYMEHLDEAEGDVEDEEYDSNEDELDVEEDEEEWEEVEEEMDELALEYAAMLEAEVLEEVIQELVEETGKSECKDCKNENAHVHTQADQQNADRLAGLLPADEDDKATDNNEQQRQNDQNDIVKNGIDNVEQDIQRESFDSHEHPKPYSSNYRTDRDTSL